MLVNEGPALDVLMALPPGQLAGGGQRPGRMGRSPESLVAGYASSHPARVLNARRYFQAFAPVRSFGKSGPRPAGVSKR